MARKTSVRVMALVLKHQGKEPSLDTAEEMYDDLAKLDHEERLQFLALVAVATSNKQTVTYDIKKALHADQPDLFSDPELPLK